MRRRGSFAGPARAPRAARGVLSGRGAGGYPVGARRGRIIASLATRGGQSLCDASHDGGAMERGARAPLTRRSFLRGAVALGASWTVLPRLAGAAEAEPRGEWLAGDLHVHTVYSSDVWDGPILPETTGNLQHMGWTPAAQISIAQARGLDFLAITDHNTVAHLADPGYASSDLVLVPGYEQTLKKGHAGILGVRRRFTVATDDDGSATRLRDTVRRAGGLFLLNHPNQGTRWRYSPRVRPDAVEVWNRNWPWAEVAQNIPWWEERYLRRGRMPATGGSDNHYRARTAQSGVGQPTTWVFARARTWRAVLDGIRAGRTMVSAEPPALGGPTLALVAESGSRRFMIGDAGTARGPITVLAQGTGGHVLRLVVDGVAEDSAVVASGALRYSFRVNPRRYVRAELRDASSGELAALTSPIYIRSA